MRIWKEFLKGKQFCIKEALRLCALPVCWTNMSAAFRVLVVVFATFNRHYKYELRNISFAKTYVERAAVRLANNFLFPFSVFSRQYFFDRKIHMKLFVLKAIFMLLFYFLFFFDSEANEKWNQALCYFHLDVRDEKTTKTLLGEWVLVCMWDRNDKFLHLRNPSISAISICVEWILCFLFRPAFQFKIKLECICLTINRIFSSKNG